MMTEESVFRRGPRVDRANETNPIVNGYAGTLRWTRLDDGRGSGRWAWSIPTPRAVTVIEPVVVEVSADASAETGSPRHAAHVHRAAVRAVGARTLSGLSPPSPISEPARRFRQRGPSTDTCR